VAAALRKEPGLEVELIDGNHGEFTVAVDGQVVSTKTDSLPSVDQVVAAVKKTAPVGVGA
jgi:VCBS repeat-containing protein